MSERLIKLNNTKKNIKTFASLKYYSYLCNVIKKQRLLIRMVRHTVKTVLKLWS